MAKDDSRNLSYKNRILLDALSGPFDSRDVERLLYISNTYASRLCRELALKGDLCRWKVNMYHGGIRYMYALSLEGENKVRWLKRHRH